MSTAYADAPQTREVVKFFDRQIVGKQNERWLGSLGDFVDPDRKQQLDWIRAGGIELPTVCLQRFGNTKGFLPRGYLAPLELGADPLPAELLRNLGGGQQWAAMVDGKVVTTNLQFLPTYPGDAFDALNNNAFVDRSTGGMRIGVGELTSLYGLTWDDAHKEDGSGFVDQAYNAFFPQIQREPTLEGIKRQIQEGIKADSAFKALGENWLALGEEFSRWAHRRVEMENTMLKKGINDSGHAYSYSPLAILLIEQLDLQRQDQPFAELSRLTGEIGKSVQFAMNSSPSQSPAMSLDDIMVLATKLAKAKARIAELENGTEKKEHWKTREKREREQANEE